jgi:hypothetical protein
MKHVVVIALATLALAGPVSARSHDTVLYDATGGRSSVVREVEDFSQHGVNITRKDAGLMSCGKARKHAPDAAIVVCLRTVPRYGTGSTTWCGGCQTIIRIDPADKTTGTVCHEMMHAITHIDDRYDWPQEGRSCVWGHLDHLGPFDLEMLAHH